jgi:two-component system, OmpR family, KDP operon response regulator KdpE
MKRGRVLVVDDEAHIRRAVGRALSARDYEVTQAEDGLDALDAARAFEPDLVVLDLNMPRLDGLGVIRELRTWTAVPVLVLSVREDETDKVEALDLGADDYLTKPFGIDELMARVRALLRRTEASEAVRDQVFRAGDLEIDIGAHRVTRGSEDVRLTRTEWGVLETLSAHPGQLMQHRALLERVWGPGYSDDVEVLRVFISQVRKKIEEDPAAPRIIVTDPGIGYRWMLHPEDREAADIHPKSGVSR